jgi:hypothetical protein
MIALDHILLGILFFLGLVTKLIIIPFYMFYFNIHVNDSIKESWAEITYYAYNVITIILTFIVQTIFIIYDFRRCFLIMWFLLLVMNITIFILFYNKKGNYLGVLVGFVLLVREIIYMILSFILIVLYFKSPYDSFVRIYGGIIWGFSAVKIVDCFPKFYLFNQRDYLDNDNSENNKNANFDDAESILNSINICILSVLTVIYGFSLSGSASLLISIVYILYVISYFIYKKVLEEE